MEDSSFVRVYNGKHFLCSNNVYANGFEAINYGSGLVGIYSDVRYQSVFSMGASYKPALDGSSLANHYGIAWTHENTGGQSKAGLGHQMLITEAGVTQTAIGNGIWTRAGIYAAGKIVAPKIEATSQMNIPVESGGSATGNTWKLFVEI